jgi:alpha-tubulin suppressor-like RCC1 family protein
MGNLNILIILVGLIASGIALKNITPSITKKIAIENVDNKIIKRKEVLFDAINRYRLLEGKYPLDMNELISSGYFLSIYNNNGYDKPFSFVINEELMNVTISTEINNQTIKNVLLNTEKSRFNVFSGGGDIISTTFVLPDVSTYKIISGVPIQDGIPNILNKFWYDTSSGKAILKKYNSLVSTWEALVSDVVGDTNTTSIPSLEEKVFNVVDVLETNTSLISNGDIAYKVDSINGLLQKYIYINNKWVYTKEDVSKNILVSSIFGYTNIVFLIEKNTNLGYYMFNNNYVDPNLGFTNPLALNIPKRINSNIQFKSFYLSPNDASQFVCGIGIDDKGYCWGNNNKGQLGVGDTVVRSVPTEIFGNKKWEKFEFFENELMCGIEKGTKKEYCWGLGSFYSPTELALLYENSNCVVSTKKELTNCSYSRNSIYISSIDNKSYGIGNNTYGQLGNGTTTNAIIPTLTMYNFKKVTSNLVSLFNLETNCGISEDDSVYCWGRNDYGQLGVGQVDSNAHPYPLLINRSFSSIIAGSNAYSICGIETGTNLGYCWGENSNGRLGDGTTINRSVPTAISGEKQWKSIVVGGVDEKYGIELETNLGYYWGVGGYLAPISFLGLENKKWKSIGEKYNCGIEYETDLEYCYSSEFNKFFYSKDSKLIAMNIHNYDADFYNSYVFLDKKTNKISIVDTYSDLDSRKKKVLDKEWVDIGIWDNNYNKIFGIEKGTNFLYYWNVGSKNANNNYNLGLIK